MRIENTPLDGLLVLRPAVHRDDRGHFLESFNERAFAAATGLDLRFVQDNESVSRKSVVRGLHLQAGASAQAKLVRVARGAVLDVCVDLRAGSPTLGRHFSIRLDDSAPVMLFIPEGFAHGLAVLEDNTLFQYKCSRYWDPAAERTLLWNDPALGIDWGVTGAIVNGKDQAGLPLRDLLPTLV
ncbi:MAG TPA: dTDP-4-dehydrorhamnose 3,5-epimerase [Flavobacteriales bacterium]|nr:dTDP-4-dehydrorhamnose 3,5-epimerase [Flavobacteriales bacterium]HQW86102.1 dTDP-4-dehydrorhamnose 3,5-epimerase [Flavobacteriales bacterium]